MLKTATMNTPPKFKVGDLVKIKDNTQDYPLPYIKSWESWEDFPELIDMIGKIFYIFQIEYIGGDGYYNVGGKFLFSESMLEIAIIGNGTLDHLLSRNGIKRRRI